MIYDKKIEQLVLSSMLIDKDVCMRALELVRSDSVFYKESHRDIFKLIRWFVRSGKQPDVPLMYSEFEAKGGGDVISALIEISGVASAKNVDSYCERIIDLYKTREILSISAEIQNKVNSGEFKGSELLSDTQGKIYELLEDNVNNGVYSFSDLMGSVYCDMEKYHKNGGVSGIKTGFYHYDKSTTGMHPGELTVLAGRPGSGKTAFALNIAVNVAKDGYSVLIFELEMARNQLVMRALCSEACVSLHSLRAGVLPKKDFPKITQATEPLSKIKLFVSDCPTTTPQSMLSIGRSIKRKYGLDLIIFDFLQLSKPDEKCNSREREVAEVSRMMKLSSKMLDCHVIALSQLNRKSGDKTETPPTLSELRESGAIEQDADNVVFVYNDGKNHKISIGKQRNGPVGVLDIGFIPYAMKFVNETTVEDDFEW